MSSRNWLLRVKDILDAINSIQECTKDKTFTEFAANMLLVKAVLYDFIVIGEAAVSIPAEVQAKTPEIPWRLMGDMRNVVAHEYLRVEPEIIWDTVNNNLPSLIEPLQKLLEANEAEDSC
ncbi:MAG: DUF86 domain-containing protein [Cyanophyceae cyanobacterium]